MAASALGLPGPVTRSIHQQWLKARYRQPWNQSQGLSRIVLLFGRRRAVATIRVANRAFARQTNAARNSHQSTARAISLRSIVPSREPCCFVLAQRDDIPGRA